MNFDNSELQKPVYFSAGTYPRMSALEAAGRGYKQKISEPLIGELCFDKIQVCPQNHMLVNRESIYQLKRVAGVEWRLHSNVRLTLIARVVDARDWSDAQDWFQLLRQANQALGSPTYTLHAGKRIDSCGKPCDVRTVIEYTRHIASMLGVRVGLEGHYPTADNKWLINSWTEYAQLLGSGVDFVVDLSHLNIVAHQSGRQDVGLVKEMLESPNCVEIHISDNDGISDQHRQLSPRPWWWDTLCGSRTTAPIFSEGVRKDSN